MRRRDWNSDWTQRGGRREGNGSTDRIPWPRAVNRLVRLFARLIESLYDDWIALKKKHFSYASNRVIDPIIPRTNLSSSTFNDVYLVRGNALEIVKNCFVSALYCRNHPTFITDVRGDETGVVTSVQLPRSLFLFKSTRMPCLIRKSAPISERLTAATMKFQLCCFFSRENDNNFVPNVAIGLPSGP